MPLPGGVLQESRWNGPGARAVLATCLGEPRQGAAAPAGNETSLPGWVFCWNSSQLDLLRVPVPSWSHSAWELRAAAMVPLPAQHPGSQTSSTLALVAGSVDACLFCLRRRELLACLGGGPGLAVWSHSILPADARCSEQVSSGTKRKLCES